jgi:hypothetical protein
MRMDKNFTHFISINCEVQSRDDLQVPEYLPPLDASKISVNISIQYEISAS